jgi:hypothetical protein
LKFFWVGIFVLSIVCVGVANFIGGWRSSFLEASWLFNSRLFVVFFGWRRNCTVRGFVEISGSEGRSEKKFVGWGIGFGVLRKSTASGS